MSPSRLLLVPRLSRFLRAAITAAAAGFSAAALVEVASSFVAVVSTVIIASCTIALVVDAVA